MIARLVLLLALLTSGSAWALTLPDHPDGRVNDYAGVLDTSARARLEQQIAQATAGRSLQVAVAIFPSLDGGSIEDTSIRLAEKWKIGGKSSDDGVLITVFVADRKMRIEVGYGLEGALPDVVASRIIAEVMAPRLRAGDLEGGLRDGVAAVLDKAGAGSTSGAAATTPSLTSREVLRRVPGWLVLSVIAVVVLFVVLFVLGGARSGRGGGGYSGGSSGWARQAGSSLLWNILWGILSSILSGGGRGDDNEGSWGGGGGGGGGGFSGGGGSFGGGGASGSW